jgi:acyl-CoA thioesterase FadM
LLLFVSVRIGVFISLVEPFKSIRVVSNETWVIFYENWLFTVTTKITGEGSISVTSPGKNMRRLLAATVLCTSTCAAALLTNPIPRYPLQVFIEDTDAYSVVYYANYLRFVERAAFAAIGPSAVASALDTTPSLSFGIRSANGIKYAAAARLGDACVVDLKCHGLDDAGQLTMKASLLRQSDGAELWSAADVRFGFVDAKSGVAVSEWPLPLDVDLTPPDDPCAKPVGEAPAAALGPSLEPPDLVLQPDVASACGTVDLHAAARYFERHRTTYLGGPDKLEALASDNSINVVVARINQLRLLPAAHAARIGTPLEVRCAVKVKARGTQVVFDQWLVHGETEEPLAKGEVTCLVIDPVAGKIVPAPDAVVQRVSTWMS